MKLSSRLPVLFGFTLLSLAPLSAQTDTAAPSVPANLAGTAASTSVVVLYWTQSSDNTAVAGYDIYRDGMFLLTHGDNTYRDTGLVAGSSHIYRVAARDAAGNVSAPSAECTVTTDSTENPRLIQPGQLSYLGAFRLPGDARNDYSYGGGAIGYNPANNSLFARGHDWYQLVGEVSIPVPSITSDFNALPVASVLQNQTDITEGHRGEIGPDGAETGSGVIGGMLVYNNRLIGTSYVYYDAGGSATRSHFTSSLDLSQTGDFRGMYRVGTLNPGFVAGYMAHIPQQWQTALGGTVLTGLSGVPIVSRSSYGPTISVFDPASLGVINPAPSTLLVGYTYEHATLGTWENSTELNPQYNMNSSVSGAVFPYGSDSILLIGTSGVGVPGYGEGTTDPALDRTPVPGTNGAVIYVYDPAGQAKGTHSYPYVAYVWAYRASDLARVVAGELQPWQVVPYATWILSLPFGPYGHNTLCGAAYDPVGNRIYLSQYNAVDASPVIHVYKVQSSSVPDNEAPTVPSGLSASATTATGTTLTWTASMDNIGVNGYAVFRNGNLVGTRSSNSYTDYNLSPATTYSYAVSAYDAAGNSSARCTAVAVRTLAGSSSSSSSGGSSSSSSSSSSGSSSGKSSGGGGAPGVWFVPALGALALTRFLRLCRR